MTDQMNVLIDRLPAIILGFGGKLLLAIIIYIVGQIIAKMLANLMKKVLAKGKMDSNVAQFLSNLIYGILLIFVILAAIARIGVQTTSFIAILGAATLAIGMAMQGTFGEFLLRCDADDLQTLQDR
jgi:small conductance mechanosensitive channel